MSHCQWRILAPAVNGQKILRVRRSYVIFLMKQLLSAPFPKRLEKVGYASRNTMPTQGGKNALHCVAQTH